MSLKVYNTLTGGKEDFIPLEPGRAKIYVCGVTPYNHPHIGNARPFVTWDVFRRYLEYSGYDVLHVQNFTDIDDKIIKNAQAETLSWREVADKYIESYFAAMDRLGIKRAHIYPRVSEHISEVVAMAASLVEKGYAYASDGNVYYRVENFHDYGKLSKRNLADMQAGARVDVDENKEHPMDFALWKAARPGEPSWESPWGRGRPGWHIECSAMSLRYLGAGFDLHGGGSDLIFPHHENEIAQAEAATGCRPFVRYWLHNGFITLNKEKMSKSLGNFFLVKDILEKYDPQVLRFFLLATHYRSPLDFSGELMDDAKRALERLGTAKECLARLKSLPGRGPNAAGAELMASALRLKADFIAAMDDDFNTALAVSYLFALAKEINIYAQKVEGGEPPDGKAIQTADDVFGMTCAILGVLETGGKPEADGKTADVMAVLIKLRQAAREGKDYKTADSIRNDLSQIGVMLEDTPRGVQWKFK
ncbi:MAG: cysteine--tRNA ligase [Acidaminococcales bacterium]|jgi:cysteinyl-tRNA synthetase|nr:cysteine--tRNA ligase [Acidaminococcales bacterium]